MPAQAGIHRGVGGVPLANSEQLPDGMKHPQPSAPSALYARVSSGCLTLTLPQDLFIVTPSREGSPACRR